MTENPVKRPRELEHLRAEYAYTVVKEVLKKSQETKKKEESEKNSNDSGKLAKRYKSYVKRAPAMILTNGLAQTLAFYRAKMQKEEAYKLLYDHIVKWLQNPPNGMPLKYYNDWNGKARDAFEWLIYCASDIEAYQATMEVLALLSWMRRFAEAEIQGEDEEG